jgi:tRNA wybutosine-synthesizing protein 4
MDFNSKNFRYITEPFGKVMARAGAGERVYLRALSRDKPSERPANIQDDFPGLADDFSLPLEMRGVNQSMFSSVLRISGRTNMWLHYDVRLAKCTFTRLWKIANTPFYSLRSWPTYMPKYRVQSV